MKRIRFTVTQEHIAAEREWPPSANCPVARALRVTGGAWFVAYGNAYRGSEVYLTSLRTNRFIEAWDAGRPVTPFTGEVRAMNLGRDAVEGRVTSVRPDSGDWSNRGAPNDDRSRYRADMDAAVR